MIYASYPETGITIEREHWYSPYKVWQRKRFIGARRRRLSAIRLAQDAGAR